MMFPPPGIALAIVITLGLTAFGYRTGYNMAENKYLEREKAAATQAVEQVKEAQESDQQVVEQRAESVKVVTRVITKVQREIVKLPTRDCGLTPDERMSINAAYCISFPDSTSCVSNAVPTSSGATGGGE